MKRLFIACFMLTIFLISGSFAGNFNFPQSVNYGGNGILPTSINTDRIQVMYTSWLSKYYTESGSLARVKFDDPTYTVSEGIGYGMLIMVYMENATNNTKAKFDKLWAYYKKYKNSNGVMNWKINGFGGVTEANGATDAELDAALALVMAYYQWGGSYLTEAKTLIAAIRQHEVNSGHYFKPGDAWDDAKNPSYFSTAAARIFASVDAGQESFWNSVATNSYSLINRCANSSTGLVPDWCSESGGQANGMGYTFSYDAVRTPWRMAHAFYWYGDSQAATINTKMASWIKSLTNGVPGVIRDGYQLSGALAPGNRYSNNMFTLAFACAGAVSTSHQDWLNSAYSSGSAINGNTYYNATVSLLMTLLLSGNLPNFSVDGGGVPNGTDPGDPGVIVTTEGGYQPGKGVSGFTLWGTYVDFQGSTVSPASGVSPVVLEGADSVAKATFSITHDMNNGGTGWPFVGLMMVMNSDNSPENASTASGIRLSYKASSNIRVAVLQPNLDGTGEEWGYTLPASGSYTNMNISFSQFTQPDWVTTAHSLDKANFVGLKFELKDANGTGLSGNVSIQSLSFTGWTPPVGIFNQRSENPADLGMNFQNNRIQFQLSSSAPWSLSLFSLDGKRVQRWNSSNMVESMHQAITLPSGLESGVKIAVFEQNGMQQSLLIPGIGTRALINQSN